MNFPLFGAQYDFHLDGVVDCPEFLVYPPLLNQLAADYNLYPTRNPISFADNFYNVITNPNIKQDSMDLLLRMEALEPWYNNEDTLNDLTPQKQNDYEHVVRRLSEEEFRFSRRLGTLSLPDWEVATLYSLVAFQKK